MHLNHARNALLTDFGKATLQDRYLLPNETYQDMFARVAKHFADNEEHAQRLYDAMSRLWFMPSTPILSNGGNSRGLPISCFLSEVTDNMEGIVDSWVENTWLACRGGGLGTYWGNVRSIGEQIGAVGKSSGVVPFLKVQDSLTLAVSQGALRRASSAVYMPISHPEIEEFIEIRRPTGGDPNRKCLNLHNAVVIDDEFMNAVVTGAEYALKSPKTNKVIKVVKARDLWMRILTARLETGEPYVMFVDNVNKDTPDHHQALGLDVHMSNLCVAPETKILTREGYKTICELDGQNVELWNGLEWSTGHVRKTGVSQDLIRVTFSDGSTIDCTPDHKFYVQPKYNATPEERRAIHLRTGDRMEKFDLPEGGCDTKLSLPHAYSQGFYAGDGNENYEFSWIYSPKEKVIDRLTMGKVTELPDDSGRRRWTHGVMPRGKYFVPLGYDLTSKLEWLAGLLDADGCVLESDNAQCLQLVSTHPEFLRQIKLMLQELGVDCSVYFRRPAGDYDLPRNDGSGENGSYSCQELWAMGINCLGLKTLLALGMKCNRLQFDTAQAPNRSASRFVTVVSLENTGRISDTYCFNEPIRHKGMFNGILAGNCSEITLPTGIDHLGNMRTAVCCLASLNLETYDEWKDSPTLIPDVLRFLDNVLQDFIDNAPESHNKAKYSAMRERSVGLGVMGLHGLYQQRGYAWESKEAEQLNLEVFRLIDQEVTEANHVLGRERGACLDALDVDPNSTLRFSNCTAIAPTASISIICGGASAGVEPMLANCYLHKTLSGSFYVKNKRLEALLESKGMNTQEVWTNINANEGSVQQLDFLSDSEKEVFKTAFEINQECVIKQAADRGRYVDQAQSLNLFLPPTVSKKTLHTLHLEAWKSGLKTLYYCRSKAARQTEKISNKLERQVIPEKYQECQACQ